MQLEVITKRGHQIIIRPMLESDAKSLAHHMSDKDIIRNLGLCLLNVPVGEGDILRRFYARRSMNDIDLCILVNDEPAGVIELGSLHPGGHPWIGYWIGRKFWHKGFMSTAVRATVEWAFQEYNLHEMHTAVMPWNDGSKGVLRKVGFEYLGLDSGLSFDLRDNSSFYKENYKIYRSSLGVNS